MVLRILITALLWWTDPHLFALYSGSSGSATAPRIMCNSFEALWFCGITHTDNPDSLYHINCVVWMLINCIVCMCDEHVEDFLHFRSEWGPLFQGPHVPIFLWNWGIRVPISILFQGPKSYECGDHVMKLGKNAMVMVCSIYCASTSVTMVSCYTGLVPVQIWSGFELLPHSYFYEAVMASCGCETRF